MNGFDDDLNYIHTQFTSTSLNIEYTEQETHDPWYQPLETSSILLADITLPTIYNQIYESLLTTNYQQHITLSVLSSFLEKYTDIPTTKKIISVIGHPSPDDSINQDEFNLALSLLACSQQGLDVTLETIQQHREELPIPQLYDLQFNSNSTTQVSSSVVSVSSLNIDSQSNSKNIPSIPSSPFDTITITKDNNSNTTTTTTTSKDDEHHLQFNKVKLSDHDDVHDIKSKNKTVKDYQWFLEMDLITVELIPQKQGRIFKYVGYLVKSQLNQTCVKRRFTEFYILWETLIKRYPLRVVPNLPPKIMKSDDAFLERRRRGLARFMNAIVRHSVLNKDEIVQAFLSNEDFQNWYDVNQPSMEEEYIRTLPNIDFLRSKIPRDINDKLKRLQQRLKPAIEQYNKMIMTIQQLTSNEQAIANDMTLYSVTLSALNEINQQFNYSHCDSCQNVNKGQIKVAQTMENMAGLLDDKSLTMLNVFLEQLKYHRDLFLAIGDMLNRKNQLDHSIQYQRQAMPKSFAAKVIMSTYKSIPSSPSSVAFPIQQRRLSKDQINIMLESDYIKETLQQHRIVFIHYCLASELIYIHQQQVFLSLMYQEFVHQQNKLVQQEHCGWISLQKQLKSYLPDNPDDFA
ncbi:unnamed protein product [Cunninghamella blakesleeana]